MTYFIALECNKLIDFDDQTANKRGVAKVPLLEKMFLKKGFPYQWDDESKRR